MKDLGNAIPATIDYDTLGRASRATLSHILPLLSKEVQTKFSIDVIDHVYCILKAPSLMQLVMMLRKLDAMPETVKVGAAATEALSDEAKRSAWLSEVHAMVELIQKQTRAVEAIESEISDTDFGEVAPKLILGKEFIKSHAESCNSVVASRVKNLVDSLSSVFAADVAALAKFAEMLDKGDELGEPFPDPQLEECMAAVGEAGKRLYLRWRWYSEQAMPTMNLVSEVYGKELIGNAIEGKLYKDVGRMVASMTLIQSMLQGPPKNSTAHNMLDALQARLRNLHPLTVAGKGVLATKAALIEKEATQFASKRVADAEALAVPAPAPKKGKSGKSAA